MTGMADIRLNKIIRQYNVGLDDLVNFLQRIGVSVDASPNSKVSDEHLPAIAKQFSKDLELKQAADKIEVKMTEILEKTRKRRSQQAEEEEEQEHETIIKSNTFFNTKKETESMDKPAETPSLEAAPVVPAEEVAASREPEVAEVKEPELVEVKAEADTADSGSQAAAAEAEVQEGSSTEAGPDAGTEPAREEQPEPESPAEALEAAEAGRSEEPGQESTVADAVVPVSQAESEAEESAVTEASVAGPAEEKTAGPEKRDEGGKAEAQPAGGSSDNTGFKVVGKIDLSQFEHKPAKKRGRISKGTQKVDVTKAGAGIDKNNHKKDNNNQQRQSGKNRDRNKSRFKPAMTEAQQEELQKEIQKQVKETYARMNEGKKNNFGAKYRKEKREAAAQRSQEEMAEAAAEKRILKVTEFVTVNDLATLMDNMPVVKVIGACMSLGLMVSINQRLDAETLVLVAEEFGYKVEFVTADISEEISSTKHVDKPEDLKPRPPIITVMGHVDHGKTSLLDYIRKSNVIAGEAGGITQHIGAYNVTLENGRQITFLDTPGHEAFTAMRARGAQLTDLAIIIIAADDSVMPQTVEAINHAQAAGVPMVFAINKIDKAGANPDTIRRELAEMNILVEDWGGKYQCQEISAKQGINVDKLLEKVLLETDLLELKANPDKPAAGAVIESSLDKGRGYLATVLVQEGTLRPADIVLCGSHYGRVKSMFNERGQKITEAGPSTPVSVLGLNGAPPAGEKFNVLPDEREAKSIAARREQLLRIQGIKTQKHMTLEEIGRRIAIGNFKELNIIVKGDVDGSVEALSDSLIKLSTEEVKVNVIHKAVGGISESDVLLAEASDAVIVGFQVRPTVEARKVAEREGIEIRLYSVIYDCIDEVRDGIEGMLEPEKKEEVIALAEVKQTFRISKVGTIAGCLVRDGKMVQKSKVRLIRDGIVVYTGELASLQTGKDAVKEVIAGKECGMSIAGYNDIKEGDLIEAFQIVEIKRTL